MKKLLFVFTLCILSTSMVWGVDYLINEGFEGTTFPPTGWTNNGCVNSSNNPKTGSKDLCFNGANDNIYTPKLVDPYILSFWYRRSSKSTAWTLNIQISTDASNWTSIGTITSVTTTYQEFTYNLSSYSNIYIRLLDQRSTGTNERYVDDFTVTKQVSNPIIEISTTTLTGFSYVQGSGPSSTKTFTISGSNLTANISINAPTDYEISTSSDGTYGSSLTLNQSKGSVSETTIYVRLKAGLSAGNYNNENITASSTGATDKTVTCSGTVSSPPPPNAPTANAATSVSYNKFTANWNSVSGATKYYLDVYTKGANATDLIISEYVEGSGNNKAIELYNGTGSSINLSNYSLKKQVNGDGEFVNELTLSGTLANGDTYVIVSNAGTTNLADSNFVNLETNSQALSFNGNDAVALYKNSERTQTQIDVVGVVDQTADWGKDVTLVRNSSVKFPTTTYDTGEWTSYPTDTFTYLGSHTMDSGNSYVSGYQNKDVGSVTSYEVSGLEADKTYYYVVRAYNEYGTSANSNEISVTTTSAPPPPTITVSTTELTGFSYVYSSGPSSEKTFTISGSNLTENISIDAPTDYEISLQTGANFTAQDPIVLSLSKGIVITTTIYVRLKTGLNNGTYTENINITSTGATDKSISCAGVVTANYPENTPVEENGVTITVSGGDANKGSGTIPETPNPNITEYLGFTFLLDESINDWQIKIETSYTYGAYYQNNNWILGNRDGEYIVFNIYFSKGKGEVEIPVILSDLDPTLPVELSAFTLNLNSQHGVNVMWATQSETGLNGFYVYRGIVDDLSQAVIVSPLIQGTNTSQLHVYMFTDKEMNEPGIYYYWLEAQDYDGFVTYYGSRSIVYENGNSGTPEIPLVTGIRSLFPNPFNPSATIMYELEQPANLNIEIYNNRGQLVRSFAMGQKEKGRYKLLWDGTDNSGYSCGTGMYFIKMQVGKETFVKKAALVK